MKVMKRIIAALLCMVLCLSMTGCYDESKSWVAKDGDTEVAVGIYRYYLFVAFDEAAALVPEDQEVLKAEIDGVKAEDWIRDRAIQYVRCYVWMEEQIEALNLGLTEEEKDDAASTTAYLQQNTSAMFDDIGISTSSFTKAYGEYNIKFKKLFDYYYGEGGEKEIPKEDLQAEYCKDKYYYEYIYAALTDTDTEGNVTEVSADERKEIEEVLELYRKQVQMGASDMQSAGQALGIALELGNVPYNSQVTDFMYADYTAEFINNIKEMENYEARVFESGDQMVLCYKRDINEAFEKAYNSGSDKLEIMLDLKSQEFSDYVLEQAQIDKADVEINQKAIKDFKLKSIVDEDTKMGLLDPDMAE